MNRKYYLLFLFWFLFSKVFCQAPDSFTITFENDDWKKYITIDTTGDTNIWTIGKPKGIVFNKAWEGDNAIYTDKSKVSTFPNKSSFSMEIPINNFKVHHGTFGFYFKSNALKQDSFYIVFKPKDNSFKANLLITALIHWKFIIISNDSIVRCKLPPFIDTINHWIFVKYNFGILPDILPWDTFYLEFNFVTKSGNNYEGILIDSIFSNLYTASIDEENSKKNYYIYPNPCSGILKIDSQKPEYVTIEIIDIYSRIVRKVSGFVNQRFVFNVEDITPGFYILRIINDSDEYYEKLIINK